MAKESADRAAATQLDANKAPHRLKEGLVPEDTLVCLRVEEGVGAGTAINLSQGGVYTIGRENTDLILQDEKASRKHAELGLYGPGAYVLRDLASTNGTLVNGRPVSEKVKLENGDLIQIGDTKIRFVLLDGTLPLSD